MKKKRNSRQRQMILEAVMARCDHPTADQIYLDVRARDERISRGTVYRNLGILSEDGDITNVKVPTADRYDSRRERHYHLFCTRCGRVFDAPMSYHGEWDDTILPESNFKINRHRVVFEGICSECSDEMENN